MKASAISAALMVVVALFMGDVDAGARRREVRIHVAGGGPAGLAFAYITLKRTQNIPVSVHMYDSRWERHQDHTVTFTGNRRDQIITLQDTVISPIDDGLEGDGNQLTNVLWPNEAERVWRNARQIRIMDVEDRMLSVLQRDPETKHRIHLHPRKMTEELFNEIRDRGADLFVGADGSGRNSFTVNYEQLGFKITERAPAAQSDSSLGVYFCVPEGEPGLDPNSAGPLTLFQTVFLLNVEEGRCGYVYIRAPNEALQVIGAQKRLDEVLRLPANVGINSHIRALVKASLQLFGIQREHVKKVTAFSLQMVHVEKPFTVYKGMPVFLIGEAAMRLHFWPGRGANSAIKAAHVLAIKVTAHLKKIQKNAFVSRAHNVAVKDIQEKMNEFYTNLRAREQGRAGIIQKIDIRRLYNGMGARFGSEDALSYPKILENRLEDRIQWWETRVQKDGINRNSWNNMLRQLNDVTDPRVLRMLVESGEWPLTEMAGAEIDPRNFFADPFNFLNYIGEKVQDLRDSVENSSAGCSSSFGC